MMTLLTREQIFEVSDIEYEEVEVPEWDGSVSVKGMTGAERDDYEASMIVQGKKGKKSSVNLSHARAKLCSLTICDENGERIFNERDIRNLTRKSAVALQRVFEVAQRLSGITNEDIDELVEEVIEHPFEGSVSG